MIILYIIFWRDIYDFRFFSPSATPHETSYCNNAVRFYILSFCAKSLNTPTVVSNSIIILWPRVMCRLSIASFFFAKKENKKRFLSFSIMYAISNTVLLSSTVKSSCIAVLTSSDKRQNAIETHRIEWAESLCLSDDILHALYMSILRKYEREPRTFYGYSR